MDQSGKKPLKMVCKDSRRKICGQCARQRKPTTGSNATSTTPERGEIGRRRIGQHHIVQVKIEEPLTKLKETLMMESRKQRSKSWKMEKTSQMQQLRTPVKKSGRSKIQNFLMNVKIQNFVMNYQSVKQQTVTGYDSRCGYDGVGKFRHPELRKGGQQSTKVGLMSPGSCHTFPSLCSRFQRWCVVQNPRIPMTSEFRWICFSNSLCTLCSFFLPLHVQISSRNREANRLHLDQEKTPEIQQRCWSQRHDPHGQWPQMCRGYNLDQYTKKGWPSWYKQRQAQNNKA